MTAEFYSADFKQRRSPRHEIDEISQIHRHQWHSVTVRILDLSAEGFKAVCEERLIIGSYCSLDVPGLGAQPAQVKWQLCGRFGAAFIDAIDLDRCEWTPGAVQIGTLHIPG
ncbi:MAG: hypothetical protein ACFBQW_09205 [Sphingomonadaceae bacterium]